MSLFSLSPDDLLRKSTHSFLLPRLLLFYLLCSGAICFVAYFSQVEKMDAKVTDLARQAALDVMQRVGPLQQQPQRLATALEQQLDASDFIRTTVLDSEANELAGHTAAGAQETLRALSGTSLAPPTQTMALSMQVQQGNLYIEVLAPLPGADGKEGYFSGVYAVSPETLQQIRATVTDTLLRILVVSLVILAALYPFLAMFCSRVRSRLALQDSGGDAGPAGSGDA